MIVTPLNGSPTFSEKTKKTEFFEKKHTLLLSLLQESYFLKKTLLLIFKKNNTNKITNEFVSIAFFSFLALHNRRPHPSLSS
jgi:hypothetical protein